MPAVLYIYLRLRLSVDSSFTRFALHEQQAAHHTLAPFVRPKTVSMSVIKIYQQLCPEDASVDHDHANCGAD